MTPEEPAKRTAHKLRAIRGWQISMGDEHSLDWPSENPAERDSCRATVKETRPPITRCAWIGSDNPAEPSNDATPPFEPVARKILNQIGEQGSVAGTVKEHDLGQRKASEQDDLVDVSRPFGLRSITKVVVECQVFAFAPQPWRSVYRRAAG